MLSYKKFLFFIILLIFPVLLYSQPITPVWIKTYNDPSATQAHEFPTGLAVDNSGNTYITMSAINNSWRKWRTISYNGSGTLRWQDSVYSAHGECEPSGIAINDNGSDIFVTGYCRFGNDSMDNLYTVKINGSTGNINDTANYGLEDDDCAKAIIIDNNYVYVTGYVDMDEGSGRDREFCTIKYNRTDLTVCSGWPQVYDNPNPNLDEDDEACAIAVHNGNVYVTGRSWDNLSENSRWDFLTIKYNSNGVLQWWNYFNAADEDDEPTAIAVDDNENVYVTGYSELSGSTNSDFYTISYDANGNLRWNGGKRYNGTDNGKDCAYAIALDEVGHVYVAGSSKGNGTEEDFVMIAYDTLNGGVSWNASPAVDGALRYNLSNRQDSAMAIAVEKDGSWLYVTGEARPSLKDEGDYMTRFYELPPSTTSRVFFHQYDGTGYYNPISSASDSEDYATKIVIDDNSVWVTGSSMGDDFGNDNFDCVTIKYGKTHDASCTKITAPTGTIDSGSVVTPACSVYNYGSDTLNYRIRMKVGSSSNWFYNETTYVATHLPCSKRYVTFPSYSNWLRGTHTVKCSTELSNDMNKSNDKKTDSVIVRVKDIGCSKIIAPTGMIDSGTVVTPACSVYNYGNVTLNTGWLNDTGYTVRMKIGSFYDQTTRVKTEHSPGTALYVTFQSWTANQSGSHVVSCSTEYANDMNKTNDKRIDTVTVTTYDVGCTKIEAPTDTIDSTDNITPACSVYNYGSHTLTYSVRMVIGGYFVSPFYRESTEVTDHLPATYRYVTFPSYSTWPRGNHTVKCSTGYRGDMNKGNDKKTGSVFVRVLDVGCTKIVSPPEFVYLYDHITPACSVYNYGNDTVHYDVFMQIGETYSDREKVDSHAPQTYQYVEFVMWQPDKAGQFTVKDSTELKNDINNDNDLIQGQVEVKESDRASNGDDCEKIKGLTKKLKEEEEVTPAFTVYNDGAMGYTFQLKGTSNEIVTIRIYNVLGKLLHTEKTNKGLFKVTGLPSGIYILRLEAKTNTEIRKLLIIK